MKSLRHALLLLAFLLPATLLTAQGVDHTARVRKFLEDNNCEGARTYYNNVLLKNQSPDCQLEREIADCERSSGIPEEGFIYVDYWVNRKGEVYKAEIGRGTTISNVKMCNDALNTVLNWKYSPDPKRNESERHTQPFRYVFSK